MAKQTNTRKKAATTVGGGGRATKVSRLNLKLVIPMVLVVAALGGFYIFRKSGASSGYAFVLSGGSIKPVGTGAGTQKLDGVTYSIIMKPSILTTVEGRPDATKSKNSTQYCAHFKVLKPLPAGKTSKVGIYYRSADNKVHSGSNWGGNITSTTKSGNVCMYKSSAPADKIYVTGNGPVSGQFTVGVDTIYGK